MNEFKGIEDRRSYTTVSKTVARMMTTVSYKNYPKKLKNSDNVSLQTQMGAYYFNKNPAKKLSNPLKILIYSDFNIKTNLKGGEIPSPTMGGGEQLFDNPFNTSKKDRLYAKGEFIP